MITETTMTTMAITTDEPKALMEGAEIKTICRYI